MPLSHYALNTFVAQEMAALTAPVVKSVSPEFPDSAIWLDTFVLRSIFTAPLSQNDARLRFAVIRRAIAALETYDDACEALALPHDPGSRVSRYFRALGQIEATIAAIYQSFEFTRKLAGIKLFEKNDGSAISRLNGIYNASRHEDLGSMPAENIHPVWLKNDGVYASSISLQFAELESFLKDVASAACTIAKG